MLFGRDRLLSPAQLANLDSHKYSCQSNSILDPYMQPWWNWLVTKCPLWLAPNLITLAGLAVNIVTTLIVVYHNPDAKGKGAPQWTYLLAAVGLFFYQSLDAIDGKQARRTGTSSPLGELFDHGCDSVSVIFVAVGVSTMTGLGAHPMVMFMVCFTAIALFYSAHWQTFVSGTLKFGRIDVTEEQWCVISLYLVGAVFGSEIWNLQIPGTDYTTKMVPVLIGFIPTAVHCVGSFRVILTGGVGKNGSSVAGTSVLSPSIPLALVVVPAFVICQKSIEDVFGNNPVLYIFAFSMVASKVTCKLVVAHMTKSELEYFDSSMIGPAMLFLNQYFSTYFREYYVLWVCLIWGLVDFLDYWRKICTEICDHMDIYCFRIGSQSATAASSSSHAGVSAPAGSPGVSARVTRARSKAS